MTSGCVEYEAGLGSLVQFPSVRLGLREVCKSSSDLEGAIPQIVQESALRVLGQTTPGWGDGGRVGANAVPREHPVMGFSMTALTGGMSNTVFRCSKSGEVNSTVLLRSHGEGTELFFSRTTELKVYMELARRGLGPGLHASFEDGRVEEFIFGRSLGAADMRDPYISSCIATRLGELHKVDVDGLNRDAMVFRCLLDYHAKALDICGPSYRGVDVAGLRSVILTLERELKEGIPSPLVFCHNDLQHGNFLYKEVSGEQSKPHENDQSISSSVVHAQTGQFPAHLSGPEVKRGHLHLIDFEFAAYNPRGFDVGNHFCEWMADYKSLEPHVINTEHYPDQNEQRLFCQAYLAASLGIPPSKVSPSDVDTLVLEANSYSLTSHLLWALWGLLQSKVSSINFDFVEYALQRLKAFEHFSETFGPPQTSMPSPP